MARCYTHEQHPLAAIDRRSVDWYLFALCFSHSLNRIATR